MPERSETCRLATDHDVELLQEREFYAVLLGMAAHDLRQPLQVLQSTYEWLDRHVGSAIGQAQLARGQRAIESLKEQLDRLVGAIRIQEQMSHMELWPVPLQPILSAIAFENREFAASAGVSMRICQTSVVVVSNAVMLEGILRNLVRNAIKYTPPGKRILIGCRRRGADIRVDVYDTGVGIAADQVPEVFEAFKRLDTSSQEGLGLGLYVVRRAVALLGHRIEVRSRVARGSRFSIVARSVSAVEHRLARIYDDLLATRPCSIELASPALKSLHV